MSDDAKLAVKAIVETLYRQSFVLEAMSTALNNVIDVSLANFPKCSNEECDHPGIWKNISGEILACDRHLAQMIVSNLSKQDEWNEVSCSDSIRALSDLIELRRNAVEMSVN